MCRSEEVTSMQMKSLSEPVDNVNLVKPKGKKSQRSSDGKLNRLSPVRFVGLSIHQRKRSAQRGVRRAKSVNRIIILLRSVPAVYNIESEEELEEINVVRIQAVNERAVFAKMLVKQQPVRFQIDCGASANILPLKYAEGEELAPCSQALVMWNDTKVKPVGTCALKIVNPMNNEKLKVRI